MALVPVVVEGITPLTMIGAIWIVTYFLLIAPVSFTSMMRMPIHFTIVYSALLPGPTTVSKHGDYPRLADDRGQFILHASADSGVAIQVELSVGVEFQLPAGVGHRLQILR